METVSMYEKTGAFCENKDVAKEIREKILLPTLQNGGAVTFDFGGVTGATQSFIHALVSEAIRQYPGLVFDRVFYKNACDDVREIISIVYTYMQQG